MKPVYVSLFPLAAPRPGSLTTRGLTPPAPPRARRMCHAWPDSARAAPRRWICHTWHARLTRRPCRRTCHAWTHSARAAPWLCMCHTWHARRTRRPLAVHVPRVASLGTHCPCQGICHTWHARLTRRPCRVPAHRTRRPLPGSCATRGMPSPPRPAYMPRVACSPPPPLCQVFELLLLTTLTLNTGFTAREEYSDFFSA